MMCIGGVMPFYEYEHIPGIDYLGRGLTDDVAPKQLGSACAQLGKKKTLSEMFGCCGWDVSPTELKRIEEGEKLAETKKKEALNEQLLTLNVDDNSLNTKITNLQKQIIQSLNSLNILTYQ